MSPGRIPPVVATTTLGGLARGALRQVTPAFRRAVTNSVVQRCDGRTGALTDGATSALAHAMRLTTAHTTRAVALPGYGCVDLVAASLFANVQVVTYDIDPDTLSPDLDSLRRALATGVGALVVAPLFGHPIDMPAIRALAGEFGVPVIEDAAQGAGGGWAQRPIGSSGDLVVLSFGRGKGTSAGRGGALVSRHADFDQPVDELSASFTTFDAGWRDWVVSAAVWTLARPSLYAIPSAIPSLRLGEMVFHETHAPHPMGDRAVALLPGALDDVARAAAARVRVADALRAALSSSAQVMVPAPVPPGQSGWLRLPVLASGRAPAPELGIFRPYPRPIRGMPEGRSIMHDVNAHEPGADQLVQSLVTIPTHRFVTPSVVRRIQRWAS